jgi:hypothetical protein
MASKYIQKFPIPENFPEILHDLSKEILRNQPEDIIEFCAMYFKCAQDGLVLDYPRKGKNIPCDFKPSIPKIYTKIPIMKKITADDEVAHNIAVQSSAYINDPNQLVKIKEEHKKKNLKGKKTSEMNVNKNNDLKFVVHHRGESQEDSKNKYIITFIGNGEKNSLIKSLTSEFVDDVITKVEHHRSILFKIILDESLNYRYDEE